MKRPISLILLIVFLFNIAGYNVLFWGLRYQAKQELINHLDSNTYTDDGVMTIKIPLSIPYQPDWSASYERVNGEFEHQGDFYRLVKQKLERDTLYIVCIKDHKEKQLAGAMADFTRLMNDLPGTSAALKLLGSFQKEYKNSAITELCVTQMSWCISTDYHISSVSLIESVQSVFSPPPKFHS